MTPSNSQAAITPDAIRDVLHSLMCLTVLSRPSQLLNLLVVEAYLNEHQFPSTSESRRFALEKILLDLIVDRFHFLCAVFQLDPPPLDEPYQQALVTIRSLAQQGTPELIGWCCLYYRYVRAELAIPPERFSEMCVLESRTVRRYLEYVLWRLTLLLIEAELQAIEQCRREKRDENGIGNGNRPRMVVESVPFIVILDIWKTAHYPT